MWSVPKFATVALACVVGALSAPAQGSVTKLHVPGAYQGWDPRAAPVLNGVPGLAGVFEGFVYFTGTGPQQFKYVNAPEFEHTTYGDGGNGKLSTDSQASELTVPDGGYYELTADLDKNTWSARKTTWSIIGDATPGGWEADTPMTYDKEKQVWTVTAEMKRAGSFKFRANNAWKIDFGINDACDLEYVDNPSFPYRKDLNNLTVHADGTYTITLDLHVSGDYTYSILWN